MADDFNTESLLHEITSAVPGVVYQFSARPDGSYEVNYVSRQSEAILGIKSNSNTFFEDFTRCIPKEDQFEFLDSVQKAVENVEEWRYEGRFIKPTGETIWISAHSVPIKKESRVVFNGVLVDVTDRKRAEQAPKELPSEGLKT